MIQYGEMNNIRIVLCEPQCKGFEHVPFNSALLRTVQIAYPQAQIHFLGDISHVEQVRFQLSQHVAPNEIQTIHWQELTVPDRELGNRKRLPSDYRFMKKSLHYAGQIDADLLFFTSITNTGLLSLKFLIPWVNFRIPTFVIPHGLCLNGILDWGLKRPWRLPFNFRCIMSLPHPRRLKLLALGDTILSRVSQIQPYRKQHWMSLDHPYIWPERTNEQVDYSGGVIRLGFLGDTRKGFEMFNRLAEELSPKFPRAEFVLIGFLKKGSMPVCSFIKGVSHTPLSAQEYRKRASELTYCVWTGKPELYQVTASGSFLDALAYGKPGIYLRNPYIEYYFDKMGDIGYICNDFEDTYSILSQLLGEFPGERYLKQVENIYRHRDLFEPSTLAIRLRKIVDECTR